MNDGNKEIYIPREWAEEILIAQSVCYSEGMQGIGEDLRQWIADRYPDLREKYEHSMLWPRLRHIKNESP